MTRSVNTTNLKYLTAVSFNYELCSKFQANTVHHAQDLKLIPDPAMKNAEYLRDHGLAIGNSTPQHYFITIVLLMK